MLMAIYMNKWMATKHVESGLDWHEAPSGSNLTRRVRRQHFGPTNVVPRHPPGCDNEEQKADLNHKLRTRGHIAQNLVIPHVAGCHSNIMDDIGRNDDNRCQHSNPRSDEQKGCHQRINERQA